MSKTVTLSRTEYEKLLKTIADNEQALLEKDNVISSKEKELLKFKDSEKEILKLKEEVLWLRRRVFGSKSEKTSSLFPEVEENGELQLNFLSKLPLNLDAEKIKKEIKSTNKDIMVQAHKRQISKAGIRASKINEIEIEIESNELPEGATCDKCGATLNQVGLNYVRQRIEYIPAKVVLVKVYQMSYKCPECSKASSNESSDKFMKAKIPSPLLNHSFLSSSLAARIIYQKYNMGIPLYRQEKDWYDLGLALPRSITSRWCISLSQYYLEKLVELMHKRILSNSQIIHMDETTIQCNKEKGKKPSSKSYMWILRSGDYEENKGVIFEYSSTRNGDIARQLTTGFNGTLVTDGYAGYNNLENITHAECMCHMRRYFLEAIPHDNKKQLIKETESYVGFQFCNELFKIEREIKDFSTEEKKILRQEKSKPVLDAFFAWVKDTKKNKVIVNEKLVRALTYATNQEKELSEFLSDGAIPIDNSAAERAIRPFAVHRKNWLFADTVPGAKASATLYSIVESAKFNDLDVYKYIEHLLRCLPNVNLEDEIELEKYLPWSNELPSEIITVEDEIQKINKSLVV